MYFHVVYEGGRRRYGGAGRNNPVCGDAKGNGQLANAREYRFQSPVTVAKTNVSNYSR